MSLADVLAAARALSADEQAELVRDLTRQPATPAPTELPVGVPILGRGKGKVLYMAPDFDEPMDEDFECLK